MHGRENCIIRAAQIWGLFFFLAPTLSLALNSEQLAKLIDQRNYIKVLEFFPLQPTGGEENLVYKAYGELGLGNFIPLELVQRLRSPQTFTQPLLKEYFANCPNDRLPPNLKTTSKCIVLRLFNQIPEPGNSHLQAARETFALLDARSALSRQDRVLFSLLELSSILSKLRLALQQYRALDPENVSYDDTRAVFLSIRSAGEDMRSFVRHYAEVGNLINHQLFGTKEPLLFGKDIDGQTEFLKETGLPMLFRVTDLSLESTTEVAGRNVIIQILDRADDFFLNSDANGNFPDPSVRSAGESPVQN